MAHRTGGLRCTTPATCRGSELWACCSTMVQMPQLETRHVQPDLPHTHTVALPDTLHKRRGCRLGIPRWRLPRAPGMRRSCSSWRTGARCLVVCSTTCAVLSMHRTRYSTGFGVAVVELSAQPVCWGWQNGFTALHCAAEAGSTLAVTFLLGLGANPSLATVRGTETRVPVQCSPLPTTSLTVAPCVVCMAEEQEDGLDDRS